MPEVAQPVPGGSLMIGDALGEPVEEAGGDRCLCRMVDSEGQEPVQGVVALGEVLQRGQRRRSTAM